MASGLPQRLLEWLRRQRRGTLRRSRSSDYALGRSGGGLTPVQRMALKAAAFVSTWVLYWFGDMSTLPSGVLAGVQGAMQCVAGMQQCSVPARAEYADDRGVGREQRQPSLSAGVGQLERRLSSPLQFGEEWPCSFAIACEMAHDEAIESFLQRAGADAKIELNRPDCSGRTGLSHVSGQGHVDLVALLAADGRCDINAADNDGNTPLMFAAQAGHSDVVRCLLDLFPTILIDQRSTNGFTALMKASVQGRATCAKCLLKAGADPTIKDSSRGLSAIEWAALCGRTNCVKTLAHSMLHTEKGTEIVEGLLAPSSGGLHRRKSVGAFPTVTGRSADQKNNNANYGKDTTTRKHSADGGSDLRGRRNSCQHLARTTRSSTRATGGAAARSTTKEGKEKRHSLSAIADAAGLLVPGAGLPTAQLNCHGKPIQQSHSFVGSSLDGVVRMSAVPAAPECTVPALFPGTLQAERAALRRGSDLPLTSTIPKLRVSGDNDVVLNTAEAAQGQEGPIAMKRRTSSKRRRHSANPNHDTRH